MKIRIKLGDIWSPGQVNAVQDILESHVPMSVGEAGLLKYYLTCAVLQDMSPVWVDCGLEDLEFNAYLDKVKNSIKSKNKSTAYKMEIVGDTCVDNFITLVNEMSGDPSNFADWSAAFTQLYIDFGIAMDISGAIQNSLNFLDGYKLEIDYELVDANERLYVDLIVETCEDKE